ncbi:hypothetical protein JR316_0004630 [Psilocybe cubensis]|uniref:Uncharacterized protein n=2 Tax=Psilocybe cubensis TaxID=181762 RepID=A0ACB8H3G3_PSICU|nr:hypothetical protein JR316_0004630 [Psilocybe cubensis]KAH9482530.1 hypothetical protein JR316_0004630 [Psilocybe cubensis]
MSNTNLGPTYEIVVAQTPEERQHSEDKAVHFLLRLTPSLTPVGTIRAVKFPEKNYYKLTRLVVLEEYRKYRYGHALVLKLHEWVRKDALQSGNTTSFVRIVSGSQIPVKGFYAKFGYEPEGPEYDDEGQPHQNMVYNMPLSQPST